ncbi:MAG TPA: thioredoxin family protein [Usitatibacter sp.]|jgi:thioredoxin reductase (NADPH)|nr:thioredoxin family protein [Usitatibacter sp.]
MQSDEEGLTVVALCAEWCGTCREFRPVFEAIAAARPRARFAWIDIEDEPGVLGEAEIETFPSLAVWRGGLPVHYGPSPPQRGVVERLLGALAVAEKPARLAPEASALLERIARRVGKGPSARAS